MTKKCIKTCFTWPNLLKIPFTKGRLGLVKQYFLFWYVSTEWLCKIRCFRMWGVKWKVQRVSQTSLARRYSINRRPSMKSRKLWLRPTFDDWVLYRTAMEEGCRCYLQKSYPSMYFSKAGMKTNLHWDTPGSWRPWHREMVDSWCLICGVFIYVFLKLNLLAYCAGRLPFSSQLAQGWCCCAVFMRLLPPICSCINGICLRYQSGARPLDGSLV